MKEVTKEEFETYLKTLDPNECFIKYDENETSISFGIGYLMRREEHLGTLFKELDTSSWEAGMALFPTEFKYTFYLV